MVSTDIQSLALSSITPGMVAERVVRLIAESDYRAVCAARRELLHQIWVDEERMRSWRRHLPLTPSHDTTYERNERWERTCTSVILRRLQANLSAINAQIAAIRPLVYGYRS